MALGEAPRVDIDPGQDAAGQGGLKRAGSFLVDNPWVVVGAVLFAILAWWVYGTRTQEHEVRAVFDEAVSVYSGLDVRVDGLDAGKVKKVENEDGKAVVTLGIDDDAAWPLRRGTTATLRFGSTIGNGTRIIDLNPGPENGPEIPDGGIIPNKDTVEPTEFDQIFDTFDARTRKSLQSMLAGTGDVFGPRAQELRSAVEESGPGLEALGGFAEDLARDEPALRAFVANTHRVTRTLAARRNDLSGLVGVAAATFNEFANNTRGIEQNLDKFGPAVRETRTTLARLDTSVDTLDGLMRDLAPGARELKSLSTDLRPALAALRDTVPQAVSTFRTTRKAAPAITTLLKDAQPFSKDAGPMFRDLAPMLACVRPYAPEIAALFTTWAGWSKNYDHVGRYGRIFANGGPTAPVSTPPNLVTPELITTFAGEGYALARPPGYNAGKPMFMPECGITADRLDPKKDPAVP